MAMARKPKELAPGKLRWECPTSGFKFRTTNEIKPCKDIIGQERALQAIKMGLELDHRGYNIFITGLVGTGRTTTIKHLLERMDSKHDLPPDICYMHNFRHPSMPVMLELNAGEGIRLAAEMDGLLFDLEDRIPIVFKSEFYQNRRKKLLEKYQNQQKALISTFEEKINKEGFTMISVQVGTAVRPQIVPVLDDNPVDYAHVVQMVEEGKIPAEQFETMKENASVLSEDMAHIYEQMKDIDKEMKEHLEKLDAQIVHPVIHEMTAEIRKRFKNEKLAGLLKVIERELINRLALFRDAGEEEPREGLLMVPAEDHNEDPFREFRVNVVVDNAETESPPIVIENFPNLVNVFGVAERDFHPGGWSKTDHMNIRAGAFHRATGGYLVLNALDVFIEPGVWQILKRTLKSSESIIQNYDSFSYMSTSALKPEAIPARTKIVLIGAAQFYYMLQSHDEDFRKIFKIRADFDLVVDRNKALVNQYAGFIKLLCDKEDMRSFDRSGVAAVVEHGVRLAGRQDKLSTRFSTIADIVREANYHAASSKDKVVKREHVEKALEYRKLRVNLYEEKLQERIDEGTIMIDTSGAVVGQVNALSVYNMGDYMFGKPSRITVRTALGNAGVVNIERESDMSGSIHNKGVLILTGYLKGKYGTDHPLALSASLCFEQSYGGVDGDSASSTELYAILSSLSGLPIRQDLAVTGSINQNGLIQPIGGANEKIEGFFRVCVAKGLKGTEGVIIPHQNVSDLMLADEVVQAVKRGEFHIYPVKHVEEGIEILTGVNAGKRLKSGKYQKGSVNDLVQKRLFEFAVKWKRFGIERKKNNS
ncbi:MAG: AAA family ATPase [Candidatus Krumholzibacteria bacterium]|nr:AAA family ATPase [Candidatus Krumholzibacteria bacterium]